MDEFYTPDVIGFFIDQLTTKKKIGIISRRRTGKSQLAALLLVEQMLSTKLNGCLIVPKYSQVIYIIDRIVRTLTALDIPYDINSKAKQVKFCGLVIRYRSINTLLNNTLGYDKQIVLLDDCSLMPNNVNEIVTYMLKRIEYLIYADIKKIDALDDITTYDHTNIDTRYIRQLKINRLMDGK